MADVAAPASQAELYALVDLLCSVGSLVIQIKAEGGKPSFGDLSTFMALVPQLSPAFSNISAVPAEAESLQPADQEALVAHIATKLAVVDAHAQAILAAALQVGTAAYGLYKAIAVVPAAVATPAAPVAGA